MKFDNLIPYHLHSGGANGSDYYWGKVGMKLGLVNVHHYYVEGFKTPYGNSPIKQEDALEADSYLYEVNKILKRSFPTKNLYVNNLLRRNWWQVKNSEAIYAIGSISNNLVEGGTGWAVAMAMIADIPTYVFNIKTSEWTRWTGERFVSIDIPVLTENFAGIGTRDIPESAIKAIVEVYVNTINLK